MNPPEIRNILRYVNDTAANAVSTHNCTCFALIGKYSGLNKCRDLPHP